MKSVHEHKRSSGTEFEKLSIDRKPTINGLLKIFENSNGPLSIQLNAAYGTGKSTFLEHLECTADKDKFLVIYYNAWEEELSLDSRTSFCLKILEAIQNHSTEKKFEDKIFRFQKALLPFVVSAGTAMISAALFRDHEVLKDIVDEIKPIDDLKKLVSEKFKEIEKNRATITSTKNALIELLKELNGKKIILLIDELDRCRPDFAIEILETVKHFFSIEGVFSLIGVDEKILHSIIEKRYGESIDCEGYLLRHFSFSISFSKFDYKNFCENRCTEFGISSEIAEYISYFSSYYNLTLRQVSAIIGNLASFISANHKLNQDELFEFCIVYIIKFSDAKFYESCINVTRDSEFYSTLQKMKSLSEEYDHRFHFLIYLIQTSKEEYDYFCKEFGCTKIHISTIRKSMGRTGFQFFNGLVAEYESLSIFK